MRTVNEPDIMCPRHELPTVSCGDFSSSTLSALESNITLLYILVIALVQLFSPEERGGGPSHCTQWGGHLSVTNKKWIYWTVEHCQKRKVKTLHSLVCPALGREQIHYENWKALSTPLGAMLYIYVNNKLHFFFIFLINPSFDTKNIKMHSASKYPWLVTN